MKVIEASDYKTEFPELFTWGQIDSIKFSELGLWLVNMIEHEAIECPEHKRPVYFEPVNYKHKEGHKCDARCMNARGPNFKNGRNLIPGLRAALNEIAKRADL
jgi:hypothetical protein